MRNFLSLTALSVLFASQVSQAVVRPIMPVRPIAPIYPVRPVYPVTPVYPIAPVYPIHPVVPAPVVNVDWQDIGVIPFAGGQGMGTVNAGFLRADLIKFRIPNQCPMTIVPSTQGEYGPLPGSLVNQFNDGYYTNWVYRMGYQQQQVIRSVSVSMSSVVYFGPYSQCGVRVFLGSEYR